MSDKLMLHACKIGEQIWKNGLLIRGNSLCHGITGNGFMLHNLFRTFDLLAKTTESREEKRYFAFLAIQWRTKAFMFAQALFDPKI